MAEMRLNAELVANARGFVTAMGQAKDSLREFRQEAAQTKSAVEGQRIAARSVAGALDQSFFRGIGGKIAGAGGGGGGVMGVAGGAAGVVLTAIVAFGKQVTQESMEIVAASKRLGITTEQYERLGLAAKELGMDAFTAAMGIDKLTLSIGKAKTGGEQADIFKALGIDLKTLGSDKIAQLEAVSKALMKIKDESVRMAVEAKLFGRGGPELDALLQEVAAGKTKKNVVSEADRQTLAQSGKLIGGIGRETTTWLTGEYAKFVRDPLGLGAIGLGPFDPNKYKFARVPEGFKLKPGKVAPGEKEPEIRTVAEAAEYGTKESVNAILEAWQAGGEEETTNTLLQAIRDAVQKMARKIPDESA